MRNQIVTHGGRRGLHAPFIVCQGNRNLYPKGFYPLPHPKHTDGGFVFPHFAIDAIRQQDGRDLTRFDIDFDLPDHFLVGLSAAAPTPGWRKTIVSAQSKNTLGPKRPPQNSLLQQNRPITTLCTAKNHPATSPLATSGSAVIDLRSHAFLINIAQFLPAGGRS